MLIRALCFSFAPDPIGADAVLSKISYRLSDAYTGWYFKTRDALRSWHLHEADRLNAHLQVANRRSEARNDGMGPFDPGYPESDETVISVRRAQRRLSR